MISKEQKAEIVAKYGENTNDSGKSEVQIAILTARISDITKHLSTKKKDNHSRRGLIMLVSKRRKLLDYLKKNHIERYRAIVAALGLRK
ncbi:MAG: 30S ribosomal protein S15 [Ignavibacteria bacterium]|jgi:small subunit ribosomal protein S15|nr:30S ribosomal protein S15 [Ignavibacteria bacterium]